MIIKSCVLEVDLINCILEELESILEFCLKNCVKLDDFISVLLHILLIVCSIELREKVSVTLGIICHKHGEILNLLCQSIAQVCRPSLSSTNENIYRTESLDLPITQLIAAISDCVSLKFVDEFLFEYLNYLAMYQLTNESVIKVFVFLR